MTLQLPDLLWIALSTAMVFSMQGGFLCLESGLTRSKNNINVAMKNIVDYCVAVFVFWLFGYALMFGQTAGGLIGTDGFLLSGYQSPEYQVFFLFQSMFCATAATIVSGAVAERMTFSSYLLATVLVSGLVYPLFGHWAWNGLETGHFTGWLGAAGYVDWAGSSVVHQIGGWVSLALLLVIGPRIGRFDEKTGKARDVPMSNLPLSALGVMLLVFGWIGFNGGSTLKLEMRIAPIVVNTMMAGAVGGCAGLLFSRPLTGRWDVPALLNGILAGLVAITAGCHGVTLTSAIIVGLIAGMIAFSAERLLLAFGVDDAVGAIPVHLGGGIWGALAVPLFGVPDLLGTGLDFWSQVSVQLQGVAAAFFVGFVLTWPIFKLASRFMPLRVRRDEEIIGLNVSEHGAKNENHDLYEIFHEQARTGDMSLRMPVEPFSEAGQIAVRYNFVMDRLQEASAKIEAIVEVSTDAIFIFSADGRPAFRNDAAREMFGHSEEQAAALLVGDLFGPPEFGGATGEVTAICADGRRFAAEMTAGFADSCLGRLDIVTFRNISQRKQVEERLKQSEARFKAVFNEALLGMAVLNEEGEALDVNTALADMLEKLAASLRGNSLLPLCHADDAEKVAAALREVMTERGEGESAATVEARFLCGGGKMIWVRLALTRAMVAGRDAPVVLAVAEDVTLARRNAESLQLAASVFENALEAIAILDESGRIETINRAFTQILGFSPREARGLSLRHLGSARYGETHFDALTATVAADGAWQGELMLRRKNEDLVPMWVSLSAAPAGHGGGGKQIALFSDLTERKEKEEAAWRHANFDTITGLPNRRLFLDRLSQALSQAPRAGTKVGLMFLDLDRFKAVNDTLGHKAGDDLLCEVARRLRTCVRSSDTVARLAGDEFTIIAGNLKDAQVLAPIARKITQALAAPMVLDGSEACISGSVGIAIYPDDGTDADALMRNADAALYHAKALGRNNHQFFTPELNRRVEARVQFERNFLHGLKDGELFMVYQPQVELSTRRIVGLEALLRWNASERGLIPPDHFIPLVEETGLANRLGAFVIDRVCADIRGLIDRGLTPPRVAINVSARQLGADAELDRKAQEACERYGLGPERIGLEVTENSLLASEDRAIALLGRLKDAGFKIALDDFGKGYSSLARLRQLPVQTLKIDRLFIKDLPDADDVALVTAILAMARGMEVDVIAEGVETEEQAACLAALGCPYVQGWLTGRPMSPEQIFDLFQDGGGIVGRSPAAAE
jgi:ammonium transporter, Amt family